jgi:hypothetical protein
MTEPRKPIFGFLWPKPDPAAPVDDAYRQVRKVRVTARGPVRIAALSLGSVLLTIATASLMLSAVSEGFSFVTVVGAAASASALVLVLRGWVVGTFVTDRAVTVETTWRQVTIPWEQVQSVSTSGQRTPFLGLPVRVTGVRTVVHGLDGRPVATHIYSASPDLWLRPEAFDMASLRLERWTQAR